MGIVISKYLREVAPIALAAACAIATPADAAGFRLLHTFQDVYDGPKDGAYPRGVLVFDLEQGFIYGTTEQGGPNNVGTVFRLGPFGDLYKVVYSFSGEPAGKKGAANDGAYPTSGLILHGGSLYGTTSKGGGYGVGTVFRLSTGGTEKQLYSFNNLKDGRVAFAGVVAD